MTGCVRTVVTEEGVQLLFGNNHPQLVAAVHHKYDGVAFSEEHSRQQLGCDTILLHVNCDDERRALYL